ncbi:hypothetical protein F5Y01DRAFT_282689 [Xylaria sp. FL0043]|nr:hypothetical protein F5Y01DRAFT_282689 [Xylaria sp. FL0043]
MGRSCQMTILSMLAVVVGLKLKYPDCPRHTSETNNDPSAAPLSRIAAAAEASKAASLSSLSVSGNLASTIPSYRLNCEPHPPLCSCAAHLTPHWIPTRHGCI